MIWPFSVTVVGESALLMESSALFAVSTVACAVIGFVRPPPVIVAVFVIELPVASGATGVAVVS